MFEAWTLKQELVQSEEEKLRREIRELADQDRASYFQKYNKALKDPDTYAVLNWFFMAGLHHFYLGKYLQGSINLFVMVLGIVLLFTMLPAGLLLITAIVLIEIPALFRSQIIVANHNTLLGRHILESDHFTPGSKV